MKTTIDLKKLVMTTALAISGIAFSQVGINNTDPKATLDVTAKTTDASKPEGLIAPRLTGDQIRGKNAQYTADQTGTIVYATSADTAPAGKTASITAAGYYYFDGSVWQKVGGISGSYDKTDDAWVNDNTNTMVKLGTKSDGSTARAAGTEFVAKDNGYVGIGNTSPNDKLHIVTSENNKGITVTNSTTTAGTVTRFGIGGGNPVWGALNYTNIDNSSSRISLGTYEGLEYLTVGVGGSKAGNVGVGTSIPLTKLHISDGNTSGISSNVTSAGLTITANNLPRIYWENPSNITTNRVMSATLTGTGQLSFDALADNAGSVTKQNILVLDGTSGRIGIGNNSPTVALDVSAAGVIRTGTTTATAATAGNGAIKMSGSDMYYSDGTQWNLLQATPAKARCTGKFTNASSVVTSTDIQLTGWTETMDVLNNMSSGTFTAPRTAVYSISSVITFNPGTWSSGGTCELKLRVNGTDMTVGVSGVSASTSSIYTGAQINSTIALNAGDVVTFFVRQASGNTLTIDPGAYSTYSIVEL